MKRIKKIMFHLFVFTFFLPMGNVLVNASEMNTRALYHDGSNSVCVAWMWRWNPKVPGQKEWMCIM